jgi:hypothetical protein
MDKEERVDVPKLKMMIFPERTVSLQEGIYVLS